MCRGGALIFMFSDLSISWMDERLVVVHLMYILVWILNGHRFKYQT